MKICRTQGWKRCADFIINFMHVCTKRPQKYTTPPSAIATTFTWAVRMPSPQEINHAQYIHSQIVKLGDKSPKYIGAAEMLTKVAYEAIGARGQWECVPTQNAWLIMTVDEEEEWVPRAPPPSKNKAQNRSRREGQGTKEERET